MKTFSTKTLAALLAILAGASLSACGTSASGPRLYRVSTTSGISSGTYSSAASAAGCTSENNITPDREVSYDGRDHFTACADPTDSAKLRLFGASSSGTNQLCVFPAQKYENGQIWIKKDTQGIPLVQCAAVDSVQGGSFRFPFTTYNSLFVVPLSDKADMMACLAASNPMGCPNFSFGSFR